MARKKENGFDMDSLLQDLISEVSTSVDYKGSMPVCEFAEQIIFNGNATLFPPQRAILKAFYGEPLNQTERQILGSWRDDIPFQDDPYGRTNWVEDRPYRSLSLEAGRGGSKSSLGSIFALYEFYKLISMPNPGKYYGLLPNDPIAIFVIAQTLEQVKDTLFAKIRGYAKDSTFFKSLEDAGKIEILSESIRYPAKNVAIYAKHTNSPALVGYTLKAMILDEFSRFENKEEDDGSITSTGDHLWENVGRGCHRFGAEGYRIAISSAWETGDPMERLWNTAQLDPQIIAFRLRTWDLNHLKSVSRESCNTDYIKDREKAELEFEGVRRKNKSNFINDSMLKNCFKTKQVFASEQIYFTVGKKPDKRYYVGNELTYIEAADRDTISFIHIDFSIKRDCTALALVSAKEIYTGDKPKWVITVDGLIKWKPSIDKNGIQRFVSYQNVEDLILQICSNRKVSKVTFDQFNSESTIQRLHGLGISTEKLSSTRNAQLDYYTLFRDFCVAGNIQLPMDCLLLSNLCDELTGIVIKPNGQIIHGIAGKDLSDSVVNAVYCCYRNLVRTGKIENISIDVSTVSSKLKNTIKNHTSSNKLVMGKAIDRLYSKVKIK